MSALAKKIFNSYRGASVQLKASLWFVVCSILQKGISMITVPIFTRLLTTEEYGTYSLYLSWLTLLSIFTSLNLYYGFFNNAMLKYESQRERFISSMQGLVTVTTGLLFIVYWLGRKTFNHLIGLNTTMMVMMFIDMLMLPALQFWTARQRFEYRYKKVVVVTLLQAFFNPLLGVIAVLVSDNKILARIVSIIVVDVIICGIIAIVQFSQGKVFFNKEFWKYSLNFNLPLLPHYFSGTVLNQGDRLMINNMVGKSEVAIYSVAYNIAMLMNIFLNSINSTFTPWVYMSIKDGKYKEIKKVVNLILLLMAVLVFILMAIAPEIIKIFATAEYSEAKYVIPPVAASVFFNFMYAVFCNVEFYYEKTKFVMVASIGAAVLNIVLNWMFIPIWGYLAAGYTTLVSYIIYCFAHYMFCRIICKKQKINNDMFDIRFILITSIIVVLSAIIFSILYKYTVVRFIIILIIISAVFVKRNSIISQLSILKRR